MLAAADLSQQGLRALPGRASHACIVGLHKSGECNKRVHTAHDAGHYVCALVPPDTHVCRPRQLCDASEQLVDRTTPRVSCERCQRRPRFSPQRRRGRRVAERGAQRLEERGGVRSQPAAEHEREAADDAQRCAARGHACAAGDELTQTAEQRREDAASTSCRRLGCRRRHGRSSLAGQRAVVVDHRSSVVHSGCAPRASRPDELSLAHRAQLVQAAVDDVSEGAGARRGDARGLEALARDVTKLPSASVSMHLRRKEEKGNGRNRSLATRDPSPTTHLHMRKRRVFEVPHARDGRKNELSDVGTQQRARDFRQVAQVA